MKTKRLVCLLAAASLGFGSLSAFAQDYHRGDRDREYNREYNRDHDRGDRRDHETHYYGARGPEWHRGGHIPDAYRDRVYVVNDWRMHRLAPPPRGYQWVQVGPDYVLVMVRTGVIAQIVVG